MNRPQPKANFNDYLSLLDDDHYALTKPGQQLFGRMLSAGLQKGEIDQKQYKELIDAQQLRIKQVMNAPLVNPYTGETATKIFAPRTPVGGGAGPQEVIQTGKDLFVGGSIRPDVLSNQVLAFRQQAIAGGEQLQQKEAQQLQQLLSLLTPKPTDVSGMARVASAKIGGALEGLSTSLGVQGVPFFPKPSPEQLATSLLDDYSTITPETAMENVAQEGRTFGTSFGATLGPLATGSLLSRAAQPISAVTGLAKNRYGALITPVVSAGLSFIGSLGGNYGVEKRMRSIYGDAVFENEIAPILAQAAMENPNAALAGNLASVPLQGGLNLASGIGARAFGGTLLNTLRNKPTTIIGRASDLGAGTQRLADAAEAGQILQNTVNSPNKFSAFTTGFLQRIGQTSKEAIDNYIEFKPTGALGERLGQFAALQRTMPGMANFTSDLVGEQAVNLGFALYDYVDGWNKYKQGLSSEPPSAAEALINLGMGSLFIRDTGFQNLVSGVGAGIGRGALAVGKKIPGISSGVDALTQRYYEGNLGYVQAMAEQQFSDIAKGVLPTPVGGVRQRFGGMAPAGEIRARNLVGNEVPISIGNGQIAAYDPTSNAVRLLNYGDVYPTGANQEAAERASMLGQQLQELPVERIGKGILGKIGALGGKDVVKQEGESNQQLIGVVGNHVIVRENPMGSDGKTLGTADYSIMRVADLEPGNREMAQQMFDQLGVEAAVDPYKFDPAVPRVGAPSLFDILAEQQDIESMFPRGTQQNKLVKDWFKTQVFLGPNLKLRGRIVGKAQNDDALVQLMGYDTAIIRVNPVNLDSRTVTKPGDVVSLQEILDEGQMSEAKKQYLTEVPSLFENPDAGLVMRNVGKRKLAVAMTNTQMSQFRAAFPALQQAINNIDPALDAQSRQTLVEKYTNNLLDSILKPTFKKSDVKYQPGTLVTAQLPGGTETGVVVENTDFGPVVAFGSNDWKGVVVQPKAIKTGTKAQLTFEEAEEADRQEKAAKPEPKEKRRKKQAEAVAPVDVTEPVAEPKEPATQEDYDQTEEQPGDYSDVITKFKDHVMNKMNDAQRRAINGLDEFIDVVSVDPETGDYSVRTRVPVFDNKGNNLYHSAIRKIASNQSSSLTNAERNILRAISAPDWRKGQNVNFWRSQFMVVNYLDNPQLRKLIRKLFLIASNPDFKDQIPNIFVNDDTGADEDLSPMPEATEEPFVVEPLAEEEPVDFDVAPVTEEEPAKEPDKQPIPFDLGPEPQKRKAGIVISDELVVAFLDAVSNPDETNAGLSEEQRRHTVANQILLEMSSDYQKMQSVYESQQLALNELEAALAELVMGPTPKAVLRDANEQIDMLRKFVNGSIGKLQRARLALINEALGRQSDIDEAIRQAEDAAAKDRVKEPEDTPGISSLNVDPYNDILSGPFNIGPLNVTFRKIPYASGFIPGVSTAQEPAGEQFIVDVSERKIILANINGVQIPFYLSTGLAGKDKVEAGRWYPIFGISPDTGWFNKGSQDQINDYYGYPQLKLVSEFLDSTIGDIRNQPIITVNARGERKQANGRVRPADPAFIAINEGLSPVERDESDREKRTNSFTIVLDRLKNATSHLLQSVPGKPQVEDSRDVNGDSYWFDNYTASNKYAADFVNARIPGFWQTEPSLIIKLYEFDFTNLENAVAAYNTTGDAEYVIRLYTNQRDLDLAANDVRQIIQLLQSAKADFDLGRDINGSLSQKAKDRLNSLNAEINRLEKVLDRISQAQAEAYSRTKTKLLQAVEEAKNQQEELDRQAKANREAAAIKRVPGSIINPDNLDQEEPVVDIQEDIQSPIREMSIDQLMVDPNRFQFRAIQGAGGASGSTANIENWDEELAGIVNVWKDPADNKTYVVNGHNRYSLAKKLGVGKLLVRYMKAKTDKEALVRGALINIAEDNASAIDIAKIVKEQPGLLPQIFQYVKKDRPIVTQGINMSRLPGNILSAAINDSKDAAKIRLYSAMGSNDQMDDKRYQLLWQKIRTPDNTIRSSVTIEGIEERIDDLIGSDLVADTSEGLVMPGMEDFEKFRSASEESVELRGAIRRYMQKEAKILGQTLREQNKRILEQAETKLNPEAAEQIRNANIDVLKEWSRIWKFDLALRDYVDKLAQNNSKATNWDTVVQSNLEQIKREFQDARMRFLSGAQGVGTIEGITDTQKPKTPGELTPRDQYVDALAKKESEGIYVSPRDRAVLAQEFINPDELMMNGVRVNAASPEAWQLTWDVDIQDGLFELDLFNRNPTDPKSSNFTNTLEDILTDLDNDLLKFRPRDLTEGDILDTISSYVRNYPVIQRISEDIGEIGYFPAKGKEWRTTPINQSRRKELEQLQLKLTAAVTEALYAKVRERELNTYGNVYWDSNKPLDYVSPEHGKFVSAFEEEYEKVKAKYRDVQTKDDWTYRETFSNMRREAASNVLRSKSAAFKTAWSNYLKSKSASDLEKANSILNQEVSDFVRVYEHNTGLEGMLDVDKPVATDTDLEVDDSQLGLFQKIMATAVKPRTEVSVDNNVLNLTESDKQLLRESGFLRGNRLDFAAVNILGSQQESILAAEIQTTEFPSDAMLSQAFKNPDVVQNITFDGSKLSFHAVRIKDKKSLAVNIKRLIGASAKGKALSVAQQTKAANDIADYVNMMAHAVVSRRLRAMADSSILGTFSRRYEGGAKIPSSRKQASFISYDDFVRKDLEPLYAKFREIFDADYKASVGKDARRLNGLQIFQSKDETLQQIRARSLAKLAEQEVIEFYENRFPVIGHLVDPEKQDTGLTRGAVVSTYYKGASQRILFAFFNSDIEVVLHEIAHGWLDSLPYYAAAEIASAMGKSLRQPTPTNLSRIPIEMHEEFAYGLMVSFSNIDPSKADKKIGWLQANALQFTDPNDPIVKNLAGVAKLVRDVYNKLNLSGNMFSNNQLVGKTGEDFFSAWKYPYQIQVKNKNGDIVNLPNPRWYLWKNLPVIVEVRDDKGNLISYQRARIAGDMGTIASPKAKIPINLDKSSGPYNNWDTNTTVVQASSIAYLGGLTNGVSPAVQEIMSKWIAGNGGYLGIENSVPEEREASYIRNESLIDDQLALEFGQNYNPKSRAVMARREQLTAQGFDITGINKRSVRMIPRTQQARWLAENFRVGRVADIVMRDLRQSIGDENIDLLWSNRINLPRSFWDDPVAAMQGTDAKAAALVALHRGGVRARVMAALKKNATDNRPGRERTRIRAANTLANPQEIEKLVDNAFHNHLANLVTYSEARDEIRRITDNLTKDRTYELVRGIGQNVVYDKTTKTIRIRRLSDRKEFLANLNDGSVVDVDKIPPLSDEEIEEGLKPGQSLPSWYGPANRFRQEIIDDNGIARFTWRANSMWSTASENRAFEPITLTINGKRVTYKATTTRKLNQRIFELAGQSGLMSGNFGDTSRTKGSTFYVQNPEVYIGAALINNTPEAFAGMSKEEYEKAKPAGGMAAVDGTIPFVDMEELPFGGQMSVQLMQAKSINDQLWLHGTRTVWTGLPSQKDSHHLGYYLTNDIRTALDYTNWTEYEHDERQTGKFDFKNIKNGNRIPVTYGDARLPTDPNYDASFRFPVGHIHAFEANVINPFILDAKGAQWSQVTKRMGIKAGSIEERIDDAYTNGYDSVLVTNFIDAYQSQVQSDVLIVFDPAVSLSLPGTKYQGDKLEEAIKSQQIKIANPFWTSSEVRLSQDPNSTFSQRPLEYSDIPSAFINTKYTEIANNGLIDSTLGQDAYASPYSAEQGVALRKVVVDKDVLAQTARYGIDNVLKAAHRAAAMGDIESFNKHVDWMTQYTQERLLLIRAFSESIIDSEYNSYEPPFRVAESRNLFPSIEPSILHNDEYAHLVGNVIIEFPKTKNRDLKLQQNMLPLLGNVASTAKSLGMRNTFVTTDISNILGDADLNLYIREQLKPENSITGEQIVPALEFYNRFVSTEQTSNLLRELADFAPGIFNGVEILPADDLSTLDIPSTVDSIDRRNYKYGTIRVFMVPDQIIGIAEAKEWHDAASAKWKEFHAKKSAEEGQVRWGPYEEGERRFVALWNLGSSELGGIGRFTEYDRVLDIVRALSFNDGISFQTQEKQLASKSLQFALDKASRTLVSTSDYLPTLIDPKYDQDVSFAKLFEGSQYPKFAFRKINTSVPVQMNLAYNWSLQPDDAYDQDETVREAYNALTSRLDDLHTKLLKPNVAIQYEFAPTVTNEDGSVESVDMYNSNIHNMYIDVTRNRHLYIPKATEETFGMTEDIRKKHPMWQVSQVKDAKGNEMRYIDVLTGLRRALNATQYFSNFHGVGDNIEYVGLAAFIENPMAIWAVANETRLPDNYMATRNLGPNGEINFTDPAGEIVSLHKLSLPPFEDIYTGHGRVDDMLRAYRPRLGNKAAGTVANITPDAEVMPEGSGNAEESLGGVVMAFNQPGKKDVDIDVKNMTLTADFDEVGDGFLASMVMMPSPAPNKKQSLKGAGVTGQAQAMGHKPNPKPNYDIRRAIRVARQVLNEIGKAGAAGDASPLIMQGYILTVDNPAALITQLRMLKNVISKPNLGLEFNGKIYNKEGMKGRRYFHDALDQVIRSRPSYEYAKHLGLTLAASNMEKELARLRVDNPSATYDDVDDLGDAANQEVNLKWMRHLPGHGQSQRFFSLAKDAQKMAAFDSFARHLVDIGYNPTALFETDSDGDVILDKNGNPKIVNSSWNKALREAASLMNVAAGDVRLAKDDEIDRGVAELYSLSIFSPRWWMSRMMLDRVSRAMFEKTGNLAGSAFGNPEWATKILKLNRLDDKSMLSRDKNVGAYHTKIMLQAWGMLMALIGLLYGSQALNPKTLKVGVDKNGTRLRIGDYTLRAPGSITTGIEMYSTLFEAVGEWQARTGHVNEPGFIPFVIQKVTSPLLTKASPLLSFAAETLTSRDAFGQPAFIPDEALKVFGDEVVAPYLRATGIKGFETPNINQALTKRVFWWWLHDVMEAYKGMRDVNMDKGEALLKSSLMGAFSFLGGRILYAPEATQRIWKAQKRMEGANALDIFLGKSSGMDMLTGKIEMGGEEWDAHMEDYEKYQYTNKPREWLIGTPPDAPNVWY